MKPISIINKLNESTDWERLKSGLSYCKSAEDVEELMHETMDSRDYSEYCDYHYEIEDGDKSSLSWAKKELRKLANEHLKNTKSSGGIKSKIDKIVKKVAKSNGKKYSISEGDDNSYYIEFEGVPKEIVVCPDSGEADAYIMVDGDYEVEGDNTAILSMLEDILIMSLE